ncbi:MAG TPA: YraN family protein [Chthonomonadaceae bacterium]|nr:YraN family protein [Chthonomonadaceae bacterium]
MATKDDKKRLGASGETIARRYLESRGWRILAANYRCKQGEIDLVAEEPAAEGAALVFLEVKTRRGRAHGAPVEAVDARKRQRVRTAALAYLGERAEGGEEPACRFDIVEIFVGPDGLATVTLRKAAFGQEEW